MVYVSWGEAVTLVVVHTWVVLVSLCLRELEMLEVVCGEFDLSDVLVLLLDSFGGVGNPKVLCTQEAG